MLNDANILRQAEYRALKEHRTCIPPALSYGSCLLIPFMLGGRFASLFSLRPIASDLKLDWF